MKIVYISESLLEVYMYVSYEYSHMFSGMHDCDLPLSDMLSKLSLIQHA